MKKLMSVLFITLIAVIFFWQYFVKGLVPIPADTIIGLYHPFRDLYAKNYPNGVPFKNFLITDPVRQQYPWRELAVSLGKKMELPLWNPYNLAGTPLLANFQSASFYPLNIVFVIMPFITAWSLNIILGVLLSGIFLFLYLNNLRLNKWASILGAITFSFSGFSIAWLEWGTITHVALWLPLILLSIDKLVLSIKYQVLSIKGFKVFVWSVVYLFSLMSSFFAGHLQIFLYLLVFSWTYFLARWFQFGKKKNAFLLFIILNSLFIILTAVQWIPTLQFIQLSARNIDLVDFNTPGWFIPWQHVIQFIAPDYFGNPTTLNYWGVWNYGEFIGYVGIVPLILATFAMFFRRDKKTLFFGTLFFLSLIFSFPTFIAKIPYLLQIPFLSTSQPTRLIFIIDFALAVLVALGFDYLIRIKKKIAIIYPLIFLLIILGALWVFIPAEHAQVVKSNLMLPTLLIVFSLVLFLAQIIFQNKKRFIVIVCIAVVGVTIFDLFRFGWKFTPFTQKSYLFPSTATLAFLQKNLGEFRIMTTDSRILPPNFSTIYRLQSIDGYDPLYLVRYGELIAASERKRANIDPPLGFNRIITPHNYDSRIIDLLGVKFILSLSDLKSDKLEKVFQEGETRVYENINVVPRAFFVEKIVLVDNNKDAINKMFDKQLGLNNLAIVEDSDNELQNIKHLSIGKVNVDYYSENKVIIQTDNSGEGFLVLTDSFYPTWKVKINSRQENIYRTDYNFRGITVSAGKHKIEFYNSLF
ncbi:MAG: YfhO family protein [Candidatus Levybacteria bacterium]|nr:YfhO family protein [Candidatus Levybacteria bacterium]